ncbi:hypothetical protein PENNAL_c0017G08671 [Penicillium nalgiovense]|uniref:Uncharacterized protein n=1 Tax=Penicillium nalgiovense TaxID=60175 RepID=A0A1V6YLZ7_PENNA|nr:hypothetical protein PENNAL_c0017G08671 [Penicillium nalgiovense]
MTPSDFERSHLSISRMLRWPFVRPFLEFRKDQTLPLVVAGEGVEVSAPQSTLASGTSKSMRAASLADRIERPPPKECSLLYPDGRRENLRIANNPFLLERSRGRSSGSEYEKNRLEKGVKRI